MTGDCHPALTRAPSEEEFYDAIMKGVGACEHLRRVLPTGYPRSGKSAVEYERAMDFEWDRTLRYPHSVNLPLLLFLLGNDAALESVRQYAASALSVIERFVLEFGSTCRMKTVVKPLWQQPWDREPVFWSVLAHCHMALALRGGGQDVRSFEEATGSGGKTADIHFRTSDGASVLLDIEVWNAPDDVTLEGLQARLSTRARLKAKDKFDRLPPNGLAVVSQVVVASEPVLRLLISHQGELMAPFAIAPNVAGELAALAAVADERGLLRGHDFLLLGSTLRPLHPSVGTPIQKPEHGGPQ